MVSTLPVYKSTVNRIVARSVHGQSHKTVVRVQLPSPSCVSLYNQTMGGVDLLGFFMTLVRFNFRSQKWTNTILLAYISIAISNAHKIYCRSVQIISFASFIENCISDLLSTFKVHITDRSISHYSQGSHSKTIFQDSFRLQTTLNHVPYKVHSNKSLYCVVCRARRPITRCYACGVYVCVDYIGDINTPHVEDTCWFILHQLDPKIDCH